MKEGYEALYHDIETKHFWFKSRRQYILDLVKDYPKDSTILDIGSSSGILMKDLEALGFSMENMYGIDISEKAIKRCHENGIENAFVMDAQNIIIDKKFDILIASDCLEHLKDDDKALKNWKSLMKDDGVLLVFVPAYMMLWSHHDVVNMHHRRYTKGQLKQRLTDNGFSISKASYWNFFLFFPVFLVRMISRLLPKKEDDASGDLDQPSAFNGLLYQLINFENKLLRFIDLPFGVSTFCIANKKN